MNRRDRRKREQTIKKEEKTKPIADPDHQKGVIIGFTVTLFLVLLLYYFVMGSGVPLANAETFNISLSNQFSETEASFTHLLIAECVDSAGVSHEDNITFTISGVDFEYSENTMEYYGTVTQTVPQTIEYGVLGVFADTENATSTATIIQNTTVTWTTGTLDRLIPKFQTGDWIGAIFDESATLIGTLGFYTFTLGAFSIATWQVAGIYGVFLVWMLGWGVFAANVHGQAQLIAILLFSLGVGVMLVKLYLDRRTS